MATFVPAELYWPRTIGFASNDGDGYQEVLNGTQVKYAFCFQVPKTGTLKGVEFDLHSVTTAQNLKVSFQDLSNVSIGPPDEVVDQFRVISPSAGWTASGIMSSDGTDGGVKRSVTRGDFLAVVFEWDSTQGDLTLGHNILLGHTSGVGTVQFPYAVRKTTSTWNRGAGQWRTPRVALQYDDDSYGYIPTCWPIASGTAIDPSTATTPDEVGLRFTLPFNCKIGGVWAMSDRDTDYDFVLYDAADVVVATFPWKSGLKSGGTDVGQMVRMGAETDALVAGDTYRIVLKPTTTSTVDTVRLQLGSAALREAFGSPFDWAYTSRTDAGAWTDDTTQLAPIGIIITSVEVGADEPEVEEYPNIPQVPSFVGWPRPGLHASLIPSTINPPRDFLPAPESSWTPVLDPLPPAYYDQPRQPHLYPYFFWTQTVGDIRVTQVVAEALQHPDQQVVYVTQLAVEALEDPTTPGQVRVTQVVMEFLHPFDCGVFPPPPPTPQPPCPEVRTAPVTPPAPCPEDV